MVRETSTDGFGGDEPTEEEILQAALETGVRLLARREHAESELRLKLRQRQYPGGIIDAVVKDLTSRNYLSDERFAEVYVRHKLEQGFGPRRIIAEMRKRGVDDRHFRPWLEQTDDWLARARAVKNKRFGPDRPMDQRDWGRQGRFLASRGFSPEQIARVLEGGDDDDDDDGQS